MSSQLFAEDSKYLAIASLISKDARVLDIGCGGGQVGAVLRESNVAHSTTHPIPSSE